MRLTLPLLFLLVLSPAAHAYVGPGAGLSAVGAFLALCLAVVAAVLGFFWYPIKRMIRGDDEPLDQEPEDPQPLAKEAASDGAASLKVAAEDEVSPPSADR